MALKLMQNLKETGLCFLKIFVYWLKNSNFILQSRMAELIESRTYLSTLKIVRMFPILTSRNRLINTFIIVDITPTCNVRDSSWDKSMLFCSKKESLLPSVWPGTEYTWALIWKKTLIICFESYQGIYPHTGRVDMNLTILLIVILTLYCKRQFRG